MIVMYRLCRDTYKGEMIRFLVLLPLTAAVASAPLQDNPDSQATLFTSGWTASGLKE